MAPPFLNTSTDGNERPGHVMAALSPGRHPPVSIKQNFRLNSQLIWTLWIKKYLILPLGETLSSSP